FSRLVSVRDDPRRLTWYSIDSVNSVRDRSDRARFVPVNDTWSKRAPGRAAPSRLTPSKVSPSKPRVPRYRVTTSSLENVVYLPMEADSLRSVRSKDGRLFRVNPDVSMRKHAPKAGDRCGT